MVSDDPVDLNLTMSLSSRKSYGEILWIRVRPTDDDDDDFYLRGKGHLTERPEQIFTLEKVSGSMHACAHSEVCLLHELYLTNHHSSQEHAIYGTSCLLLAFLSPTSCHLSNQRSINLILSLYPLSYSLSSFFLCWGLV